MTAPGGSLHEDAVAVLTAYRPRDAHQSDLRDAYLAHLHAHPDAMWRACAPAHLTASTIVLDASAERVLLALHRKAGLWLQMGGHCEDGDATVAAAALREAREESGLADLRLLPGPVLLDRHPAPCSPAIDHHYDVMYAAVAPPGVAEQVSAESVALGWFPVGALPEPTDDAVRALVAAAVARIRAVGQAGGA